MVSSMAGTTSIGERGCEDGGEEHVRRKAMRQRRDRIGGSRSDDDKIAVFSERQMAGPIGSPWLEDRSMNRTARDGVETGWTDEFTGRVGQYCVHLGALLDEFARQVDGFVGGHAPVIPRRMRAPRRIDTLPLPTNGRSIAHRAHHTCQIRLGHKKRAVGTARFTFVRVY